MTEIITSLPKRPNWTDRQRIAAADLQAEQAWQDAQLTRLRRFALGWGVVAGLEVEAFGNQLRINPGYGVTAAGSEIYLAATADLNEVFEKVCTACGGTDGSCADPEPRGEGEPITGWLVLTPTALDSCPRPTVPEGCAHPGADFAYSRRSAGVEVGFLCDLPDGLWRREPDCAWLRGFLGTVPVPMPGIEDDILPIAQVTVVPGLVGGIDMTGRQRLLPLWALEGLIACCDCLDDTEDEPDEPPVEIETPWDKPHDEPIGALIETIPDALPGGEADFDLSFKEVFAAQNGPMERLRRAKPTSLVTKSFAASLLVMDQAGLTALGKGEFDEIWASLGRFDARAKRPDWADGDLAEMPIGAAWRSGKTNYQVIADRHGDLTPGDLKGLTLSEISQVVGEAPALAGALFWLRQRAATIRGAT